MEQRHVHGLPRVLRQRHQVSDSVVGTHVGTSCRGTGMCTEWRASSANGTRESYSVMHRHVWTSYRGAKMCTRTGSCRIAKGMVGSWVIDVVYKLDPRIRHKAEEWLQASMSWYVLCTSSVCAQRQMAGARDSPGSTDQSERRLAGTCLNVDNLATSRHMRVSEQSNAAIRKPIKLDVAYIETPVFYLSSIFGDFRARFVAVALALDCLLGRADERCGRR